MRGRAAVLAVVLSGCATLSFPPPTGPHGVGTTRYEVTAPDHLDPYGPTPAPRRVPVQAWYPADTHQGVRAQTPEPAVIDAFAALGAPRVLVPHTASASVVDAPPIPGRYPVLLFNHGFNAWPSQNQSLLEELASHGYVVLSVGHPHESLVVRYADGAVVPQRKDLPAYKVVMAGLKNLEQQLVEVEPLLVRARAARTAPQLREAMTALGQHPSYAVLRPVLELWVRDTRVVLDALGRLDAGEPGTPLRGLVDASRVGVLGHSLGGMVAGHLAMSEPRVKAALNLDGAQLVPEGEVPYRLEAPTCFLYADTTKVGKTSSTNDGMNDALVVDGPRGSCGASVRGATHLDFTDLGRWPLLRSARGAIEREELDRVLRAMAVGYFSHHLLGAPLTGFTPSATLRVRWAPEPDTNTPRR